MLETILTTRWEKRFLLNDGSVGSFDVWVNAVNQRTGRAWPFILFSIKCIKQLLNTLLTYRTLKHWLLFFSLILLTEQNKIILLLWFWIDSKIDFLRTVLVRTKQMWPMCWLTTKAQSSKNCYTTPFFILLYFINICIMFKQLCSCLKCSSFQKYVVPTLIWVREAWDD